MQGGKLYSSSWPRTPKVEILLTKFLILSNNKGNNIMKYSRDTEPAKLLTIQGSSTIAEAKTSWLGTNSLLTFFFFQQINQ